MTPQIHYGRLQELLLHRYVRALPLLGQPVVVAASEKRGDIIRHQQEIVRLACAVFDFVSEYGFRAKAQFLEDRTRARLIKRHPPDNLLDVERQGDIERLAGVVATAA